ncbi:hypothetical protein GCM10023322_20760 [Rugosimonospora acidiphila]|uniref:FtsX extracellular domain-containing protein n=1 Tax=Rugosimonospora acidiphila TaxID=556531 RepID=A0ABP9RQL4_9ACTN
MRMIAAAMPVVVPVAVAVLLGPVGCSKPEPHLDSKVAVFPHDDATDDQRAAIDQELRAMPGVRGVSFESKRQAYESAAAAYARLMKACRAHLPPARFGPALPR